MCVINSYIKIEYNICYFLFIWVLSSITQFNVDTMPFIILLSLMFLVVDVLWLIWAFIHRDEIFYIYDFIDDRSYFYLVAVFTCIFALFKLLLIPLFVLYSRAYNRLMIENQYIQEGDNENKIITSESEEI